MQAFPTTLSTHKRNASYIPRAKAQGFTARFDKILDTFILFWFSGNHRGCHTHKAHGMRNEIAARLSNLFHFIQEERGER